VLINVCHFFDRRVEQQPDAPAITHRHRNRDLTITYRELQQRVCAEAESYLRLGLTPGDRVLMLYPLSIDLYVSVLAIFRCGLCAVFVDPGAGLGRLSACCERVNPAAVRASTTAWLMRPLIPSLRWGPRWITGRRIGSGYSTSFQCGNAAIDVSESHPALLTFTSGSTGEPRGVVRTHGFLELQQTALCRELQLASGQSELLTMPMFVLANLAAGLHSILGDVPLRSPGIDAPKRLAHQIKSCSPQRLLASPSLLDQLADWLIAKRTPIDSIQRVTTGGAPVFPRTIDKLRLAMPNASLQVVYGSTEAEPIAMLDASTDLPGIRQRIRSGEGLPAGTIASDLSVRLLSPQWQPIRGSVDPQWFDAHCVEAQQVGEIIVSGARVLRGYLDGKDDYPTKILVNDQIWHRTGDLGRLDSDGVLWLLGRATGQLHDSRGSLQPLAVEGAAMEHHAVERCALLSIAGQRVLVVQPSCLATGDWQTLLLEQLSWFQLDRVITVNKLPLDRRHHAKVDYPALRRLVGNT